MQSVASALCVAILLLLLQLLLLAAVRRRVPDGKICCWFIESDSSVFFLFIQTRYILNVLLVSTVAFTASICLQYILGNHGHGRSQGGRQPAAAKPHLYKCIISAARKYVSIRISYPSLLTKKLVSRCPRANYYSSENAQVRQACGGGRGGACVGDRKGSRSEKARHPVLQH